MSNDGNELIREYFTQSHELPRIHLKYVQDTENHFDHSLRICQDME